MCTVYAQSGGLSTLWTHTVVNYGENTTGLTTVKSDAIKGLILTPKTAVSYKEGDKKIIFGISPKIFSPLKHTIRSV